MDDQQQARDGTPARPVSGASVLALIERLDPESRAAFFQVYDLLLGEGLRHQAAELGRSGGRVEGEDGNA